MDPLAFNPQSALGIPGLLSAVRSGRVALANALGTGVADDKAMYCYVPRMIEFYLGEHAILNNVLTYMLRDPKQRQHVFNNLHNLVVKEVQGSGGYGMLIGPASTAEEREAYKLKVMQLHAARHPEQILGGPAIIGRSSNTQVSLVPPPWLELTTSEPSTSATRVSPPGMTLVSLPESTKGLRSTWRGTISPSIRVGAVESASVGWAM